MSCEKVVNVVAWQGAAGQNIASRILRGRREQEL